jgi:hypothetical protein
VGRRTVSESKRRKEMIRLYLISTSSKRRTVSESKRRKEILGDDYAKPVQTILDFTQNMYSRFGKGLTFIEPKGFGYLRLEDMHEEESKTEIVLINHVDFKTEFVVTMIFDEFRHSTKIFRFDEPLMQQKVVPLDNTNN